MQLTKSAFGLWSGGRYMHFGQQLDQQEFLALLNNAYTAGIHSFVTADVYGQGEADEMLGQALLDLPRAECCVVGAVGHDYYNGERAGAKGFPRFTDPALRGAEEYASYLRMATEKSLARIGTDYFDLLLLHNPDLTGYTSEAVWQGMAALQEAGLASQLGVAPGPANGFTLDLIHCFEKFGELIDWAMIILNPLEPWPGSLCLEAAKKYGVKVLTRVVDCGGLFHDDVKPGHQFAEKDHRTYRPQGWVEAGNEKLEKLRPFATRHGLTMLQLACLWNLSQVPVESVVPTLIKEVDGKPLNDKFRELANLPDLQLSAQEIDEIRLIGDNTGCMDLKGASTEHQGEAVADRWSPLEIHHDIAQRWQIDPAKDLVKAH